MGLKTITVLWMDDRQETYPYVETTVRDGVLHIYRYAGITHGLIAEWHPPLSNIRIWYPSDQEPPSWLAERLGWL